MEREITDGSSARDPSVQLDRTITANLDERQDLPSVTATPALEQQPESSQAIADSSLGTDPPQPIVDNSCHDITAPYRTRKFPKVSELGITVLHDGGSDPVADIVFIHGIQGHPRGTWTSKTSATSDAKVAKKKKKSLVQKMKHKFAKDKQLAPTTSDSSANSSVIDVTAQGEDGYFWPQELLPEDFPDCRILTFGYDSHVSNFFGGAANKDGITAHGNAFLNRLVGVRTNNCPPERKIIFIAHSLGGLVLKETLRRSKAAIMEAVDKRSILENTFSIMFFATPHRGSAYAAPGEFAATVVMAMGMDANDSNIKDLKRNAQLPTLLQEETQAILLENKIEIDTFIESKGYSGFGPLSGKIVDEDSARLGHGRERVEHINGNHVEMCRFEGPDDSGYTMVKEALNRHVKVIRSLAAATKLARRTQLQSCIQSLHIHEMDLRQQQIDPHYSYDWQCESASSRGRQRIGTQEWLWDETPNGPGLVEWLGSGTGIFWIRGKAGSGKSTAMKNIWRNPRTGEKLPIYTSAKGSSARWLIISAFFHDRGISIQKSLDGVLSKLLHQILQEHPDLASIILPYSSTEQVVDHDETKESATAERQSDTSADTVVRWTTSGLKDALKAITTQSARTLNICALVDALDEHEVTLGNDGHKSMVNFFQDLVSNTASTVRLKMIVSSRPQNVFKDELGEGKGFKMENFTRQDIDKYIYGKLGRVMKVEPQSTYLRPEHNLSRVSNASSGLSALSTTGDLRPEISTKEDLMVAIADLARGVFLWVRLVVEELVHEWSKNRFLAYMARKLFEFPPDLHELYEYILKRIAPENRLESYIMMELVLRSQRNLSLLELIIMSTFIEGQRASRHHFSSNDGLPLKLLREFLDGLEGSMEGERLLHKSLNRLLRDRCMGLLEVQVTAGDLWNEAIDVPGESEASENNSMMSTDEVGAHSLIDFQYRLPTPKSHVRQVSTISAVQRGLKRLQRRRYKEGFPADHHEEKTKVKPRSKVLRTVQFLHQTAKEYLLESSTLGNIFPDEIRGNAQDPWNGNEMLLQYCLTWLELPESVRDRLLCFLPYKPEQEVLAHAPWLERNLDQKISSINLLDRKTPSSKTKLLHSLDEKLTRLSPVKDSWPEGNCDAFPGRSISSSFVEQPSSWKSNFLSFAVCHSMRYYVAETLNQNPGLVNEKTGRPLLHYAAYGANACHPQLVLDLIAQGADIHQVFKEKYWSKTAIESITHLSDSPTDDKRLMYMIQAFDYLIQAGANPNSTILSLDKNEKGQTLLLFLSIMDSFPIERLKLCRILVRKMAETLPRSKTQLEFYLELLCCSRTLDGQFQAGMINELVKQCAVYATPQMVKAREAYREYPWEKPEFDPSSLQFIGRSTTSVSILGFLGLKRG
ncbi:hypothetical protein BKA65DRAFT_582695 [Rhexocercosporidium sp. MPI-PUGE-AT-0058]|nr:hypothetical protein BKA65DRAFT_582695 [Rhexocercosporidium sp. MPI-PUGE-AT-0058]